MTVRQYTIKSGDTLFSLQKKLATTQAIILKMNSALITDPNRLQVGWVIQYKTTTDVNQELRKQADTKKKTATTKKTATSLRRTATKVDVAVTNLQGKTFSEVDKGKIKLLLNTPILTVDLAKKPQTWKVARVSPKNTVYVAKRLITYPNAQQVVYKGVYYQFTQLYAISDTEYVPNIPGSVSFEPITEQEKNKVRAQSYTPEKEVIKPLVVKPSQTPEFELKPFQRPSIQFKNENGAPIVVELRLINLNASYSNAIQQTRTNAGWMLNVSGENLPVLNVTGFFMDTRSQLEFDAFMDVYGAHLKAYRDGNYYSSAICTFTHQERSYQVLILAFSYTHDSASPHIRNFQLQFLVLRENAPKSIRSLITNRLKSDPGYVSNLKNELLNPTGYGVVEEAVYDAKGNAIGTGSVN